MEEVVIIPTGDEIKKGIVLDTNSPAIMQLVLGYRPTCRIIRSVPPVDIKEEIQKELRLWGKGDGIIFLTGGSGGGRVFDSDLAVDCTHAAVAELLGDSESIDIIGGNGHLFARIVVGRFEDKLVVTLPGPNAEALSGARAALENLSPAIDCKLIARKVAEAVVAQYPQKNQSN